MEDTEVTLQDLFDSVVGMTPEQICLINDLQDVEKGNMEEIRQHGYTAAVLRAWDEIAQRYHLNRTHRKIGGPSLGVVSPDGERPTLH